MKNTKRFLAMVLSLGLILTMLSPVSLAEQTSDGKITVDNPKKDKTYTLYRVFDLDLTGTEGNEAYVYKANNALGTLLSEHTNYKALVTPKKTVVENGNTKWIINAKPLTDDTINPYDFSNWLSKLDAGNFKQEGAPIEANQLKDNVKWENLPLGYYMVKSSLGSLVALNTTDKNVIIHEKNTEEAALELKKVVKGGSSSDYTSDPIYADIGETLTYKITFKFHDYASIDHVLTDVLEEGIDYVDNSLKVQANTGDEGAFAALKQGTDYTVTMFDNDATENKLTIKFPRDKVIENLRGKEITVTYNAKLNNDAKMSNQDGINSNKNTVTLKYDTDKTTAPKSVDVRTTDFNIFKFEKVTKADTETPLAGAKFKIYDASEGGNEITVKKDGNNYFVGSTGGEIVSVEGANVTIKGLKPGTYYIEETEAPKGYNKIQGRIKLEIAEDKPNDPTKITYTATIEGVGGDKPLQDNTVKIENQKGAELPETGGIGRTIIYVLGAILFFGALILLVARKRTKEQRA